MVIIPPSIPPSILPSSLPTDSCTEGNERLREPLPAVIGRTQINTLKTFFFFSAGTLTKTNCTHIHKHTHHFFSDACFCTVGRSMSINILAGQWWMNRKDLSVVCIVALYLIVGSLDDVRWWCFFIDSVWCKWRPLGEEILQLCWLWGRTAWWGGISPISGAWWGRCFLAMELTKTNLILACCWGVFSILQSTSWILLQSWYILLIYGLTKQHKLEVFLFKLLLFVMFFLIYEQLVQPSGAHTWDQLCDSTVYNWCQESNCNKHETLGLLIW